MARAPYFTEEECLIIVQGYEEQKSVLQAKGNTVAANKCRQACWQRIADQVNACSSGQRRTWQQTKIKHRNIISSANRKKGGVTVTGGGPPPESLTPVEELAFANISGKPIMEEVEGGIKSDLGGTRMSSLYVQVEGENIRLLQPPPTEPNTTCKPEVKDDKDTLTLCHTVSDTDISSQEKLQQPPSPVATTSRVSRTERAGTDNVHNLYKRMLELDCEKKQLEIKKLKLEIAKLEHEKKEREQTNKDT